MPKELPFPALHLMTASSPWVTVSSRRCCGNTVPTSSRWLVSQSGCGSSCQMPTFTRFRFDPRAVEPPEQRGKTWCIAGSGDCLIGRKDIPPYISPSYTTFEIEPRMPKTDSQMFRKR